MPDRSWGIADGYHDCLGDWHPTTPETRKAILAAMGVDPADGVSPAPDPVRIVEQGRTVAWDVPGKLTLEDGTVLYVEGSLPPDLPIGYHDFRPAGRSVPKGTVPFSSDENWDSPPSDENRDSPSSDENWDSPPSDENWDSPPSTRVIVTPRRCRIPAGRNWGWAVQLYAVRSAASWGIGDLGDLRRLIDWSLGHGAGLLMISPLLADGVGVPQEPSPYYPSSRRFRNPLYLRVEDLPGAAELGDDLERLGAAGRALNCQRKIDRDAVYRLKEEAFRRLFARFTSDPAFERYCVDQGKGLEQFATYCALAERHGEDWRRWPSEYRDPAGPGVRRFTIEHARQLDYHKWLQWQIDEQMSRAAAGSRIVHDLPIGFSPHGADAWQWQDMLARDCTVGAPPDVFNPQGQDWQTPAFVPHKLRAARYEPFVQTLRAVLRHAGGLRIDHVMGLFRLFWIPAGWGPQRGAYIRYAADELLAVVAVESWRAGAFIVGEDLGTVEAGVRERLEERGVLSFRLLWFEPKRCKDFPLLAMAAVTTHDLPTLAGLWNARGLAPGDPQRQLREHFGRLIGAGDDRPVGGVIEDAYRLLAEAPSLLLVATLEDAMAVEEQANKPGTVSTWPNWSLALPGGLEALEQSELAGRIAAALSGRVDFSPPRNGTD